MKLKMNRRQPIQTMLEHMVNSDIHIISKTRLLLKDLWVVGRNLRTNQRSLPNFIIIGAQKAGTTSLYAYLSQHPQIYPAAFKEVHFFDVYYHKGIRWYAAHFPALTSLKPEQVTGEATPYYLFHPQAARRMFTIVPHVKLIVLLRNPVDRAISHYYHELGRGKEHLTLEQAIQVEETRLDRPILNRSEDEPYRNYAHQRFSYLSRGIYARQIRLYLEYFSPDQIHLICSERFFANTEVVYREVLRFLGCDPNFVPANLAPKRVGSYANQQKEVIAHLKTYFEPHNQELFSLIQDNFPQFAYCEEMWHADPAN